MKLIWFVDQILCEILVFKILMIFFIAAVERRDFDTRSSRGGG